MPKRICREHSYEPPFSGARTQPVQEFDAIHKRWVDDLATKLPEGVPNTEPIERCTNCNYAVRAHPKAHKIKDRFRDGIYVRCGICRVAVKAHKAYSCPMPGTYIDNPIWPATFGDYEGGECVDGAKPLHRVNEGAGYCFQCGFCQYYIPIGSRLGSDWGACSNARSEYDRQCVFEHWTCKEFTH